MAYITYNGKYITHNGKMVISGGSTAPDSVSTDWEWISFDGTGLSLDSDIITITSSGTWSRLFIDTGDGTDWVAAFPIFGINGGTCQVSVQSGFEGTGRSCIIRFTVGTATANVYITQYGYV